jgi:multidrug resistance efflux pump
MGIYGFAEHVLVIEKKCTLLPTRTSKIFTGESGYLTSHTIAVGRRIVPHEKIGVLTNLDKEETRALESINYKLKKITKSAAMRDHDISGGIEAAIALDRVRKTLEKTIRELEACTLRIAQEGIIISSQARKGYCPYFTKGSELCEIAPIDSFIIELNMLESEIGEIKQGDRAEVKLWSMMRVKLNGIVQSTAPVTLSYEKESKNAEAKSKGVEKEFKVSIVVSNIATKKVSPYMSGMVRVYAGDMRGFRLIMKMIRSALRTDLFF